MSLVLSVVLSVPALQGSPATPPAPSIPSGLKLQRATAPARFAGTYSPAHGLLPGGARHDRSGPDVLFNNMTLLQYYSYPGADQEFIDEGKLLDRNHDHREQINGFEHTYCSADPSPNGIGLRMNFYDQNVYCAGPPDWPSADCSYQLTGLPAGDPNGNAQCWTVAVDLCGFACDLTSDPAQNRYFGWGAVWDSDFAGPLLATGGHGTETVWVWYDTTAPNANAAYLGCYWFGWPEGKFALRLWGNPPEALEYSSASGPGADDRLCITFDGEAQVGNTVVASVTDVGTPVDSLLWASPARVDQDLFPIYGIDAHLLADHAQRVLTSRSSSGDHTLTVPAAAGGGRTWYLQAATGMAGTPTALSHGVELYVF